MWYSDGGGKIIRKDHTGESWRDKNIRHRWSYVAGFGHALNGLRESINTHRGSGGREGEEKEKYIA